MANTRKKKTESDLNNPDGHKKRTFITDEAREAYLISLAYDLVEKRLIEGTATSQETTHFLKLGSSKERLEKEIMEKQKFLITAKTEQIKSQQQVEELYANALSALRSYSGDHLSNEDHND